MTPYSIILPPDCAGGEFSHKGRRATGTVRLSYHRLFSRLSQEESGVFSGLRPGAIASPVGGTDVAANFLYHSGRRGNRCAQQSIRSCARRQSLSLFVTPGLQNRPSRSVCTLSRFAPLRTEKRLLRREWSLSPAHICGMIDKSMLTSTPALIRSAPRRPLSRAGTGLWGLKRGFLP